MWLGHPGGQSYCLWRKGHRGRSRDRARGHWSVSRHAEFKIPERLSPDTSNEHFDIRSRFQGKGLGSGWTNRPVRNCVNRAPGSSGFVIRSCSSFSHVMRGARMGVGGQSSQEPATQGQLCPSAKRTKFSKEPCGRLPRGRRRKAQASTLCPLGRSNPRGRLTAREPGKCGPGQGGVGLWADSSQDPPPGSKYAHRREDG